MSFRSFPSVVRAPRRGVLFVAALWAAAFFFITALNAQDLHFSQFYHNPTQLNPARTGVFEGDWRASGLYRSQWTRVPVSYQTFAGAFEWKALALKGNWLSVGLLLQNDQAGDAALRWTELGGNLSVMHIFDRKMSISGGFGIKFVQRSFDVGALKFKNQWGGDFFNANLPTKENFSRSSGIFAALSSGVNVHCDPQSSRTRLDFGVGITHLNRPNAGFQQDERQTLPMRFNVGVDGYWQLRDRTDLAFGALFQQMSGASAQIIGLGLRRVLNQDAGKWLAVQAGISYRIGDAAIPTLQLERNTWTFALSYDVNISAFQTATRGRGGPEIAVIYRPLPPAPPKTFKACPIF